MPRSMTFTSGQRVIRRSMSDAVHRKTSAKLDAKNSAREARSSSWKSAVIVRMSLRKNVVKRSAANTLVHARSGVPVIVTGRGPDVARVSEPPLTDTVPPAATVNLSFAAAGSKTRIPRACPPSRERTLTSRSPTRTNVDGARYCRGVSRTLEAAAANGLTRSMPFTRTMYPTPSTMKRAVNRENGLPGEPEPEEHDGQDHRGNEDVVDAPWKPLHGIGQGEAPGRRLVQSPRAQDIQGRRRRTSCR